MPKPAFRPAALAGLCLFLCAAAPGQAPSNPFGDGRCLSVPDDWRLAPRGYIAGGVKVTPRPDAPLPAVRGYTLLRGEAPNVEGVTLIPAAARGYSYLRTMPQNLPQDRRRTDEDFAGFTAYVIDHGEVFYRSADGRTLMGCVPYAHKLLFGAGDVPPHCMAVSEHLSPDYRLEIELPYAARREVMLRLDRAAALARAAIRPCG